MDVVRYTRQHLRFLAVLICVVGWHDYVHAAAENDAGSILEVLGELRLNLRLQSIGGEEYRLEGTLGDEIGQPLSGSLAIVAGPGSQTVVYPCPLGGQPEGDPIDTPLEVSASGKVCAIIQGGPEELVIEAHAPHFVSARQRISQGSELGLPAPHFGKSPQTMRLGVLETIEVLVGDGPGALPDDARVAVHLNCPDGKQLLGEAPATGIPLLRFEVTPSPGAGAGNCKLLATIHALDRTSTSAELNVLVRDEVSLKLKSVEYEKQKATLTVEVRGTSRLLEGGLVEGGTDGVYLTGSPVRKGIARLQIERTVGDQEVSLSYLPADASLVPGTSIETTISSAPIARRWTGAHLVGLFGFVAWLVYAWLRPQSIHRQKTQQNPPPRKAEVESNSFAQGKIGGLIRDAHTGAPIPGAVIIVSIPSPVSAQELERSQGRGDGRFELSTGTERSAFLRLRFEAPMYVALESTKVSQEMVVHLIERRRALVGNLVEWARQRGAPWHRNHAPTPGEVERTASVQADAHVESWARDVGRAVYSGAALSDEVVDGLRSPGAIRGTKDA